MTVIWGSRIKAAFVYSLWVTLPLAFYWQYHVAPPRRGEEAFALVFCTKALLAQPVLTMIGSALLLHTDYEQAHGKLAIKATLWFTKVSFAVLVLAVILAASYIGLILAIVLLYIVLPCLMIVWGSTMISAAIVALAGYEANIAPSHVLGVTFLGLPYLGAIKLGEKLRRDEEAKLAAKSRRPTETPH